MRQTIQVNQSVWAPAYIGIGSNLENPAEQVARACEALSHIPQTRLMALSRRYSNPPMGPQDQPDYVNAVAAVLTRLSPQQMLAELQALEAELGRVRTPGDRWGPRVIDLDLLLQGLSRAQTERLSLPHPGISERNFVLFPLCDIAPELVVPDQGRVRHLAAAADGSALSVVGI